MKKAKKSKSNLTTPSKKKQTLLPSTPTQNLKEKRIPRPLGITLLIKEYKRTNNRELLTKAQNMVIEQWSNANFNYNDRQTSVEEIARILNMPSQQVIRKMVQPLKNWLTSEKLEDRYEALIGYLTKNALATRAQTQGHIQTMTRGQHIDKDGQMTYTAFVSGEITRAIALIHKSDENFLKIVQELKPHRPGTAIQINNQGADAKQSPNGSYLGINEAVRLIDAKREGDNLLDNPDMQAKLLAEHIPANLPEITATKQQGISADGSTKVISKRDHTKRREDDGTIYSGVIIP